VRFQFLDVGSSAKRVRNWEKILSLVGGALSGSMPSPADPPWQSGMGLVRETSVIRFLPHVPRAESRAIALSLGVGAALTGLKFAAFFLTGSSAVFSDALESIVNVVAATFAAYSLHLAHTPADAAHPYGHGKIEFMSAGFEGGMILAAAFAAVIKAVGDFVHGPDLAGHAPQRLELGVLLLFVALVVNGGLGFYLVRTGRRQNSATLEADGHHLLSDAITSVVALAALALVRVTHWYYADPIAALLVSIYIAKIGVRLMRQAAAGLMDRQDFEDQRLLRQILDAHIGPDGKPPHICSYHKLRHRHSGRYHWVDFHMVVPAGWSIDQGHQVASEIEYEIELALGEGNATAHIEPCVSTDCTSCRMKPVGAAERSSEPAGQLPLTPDQPVCPAEADRPG
jgi:cation diffusion facilitator family transporter